MRNNNYVFSVYNIKYKQFCLFDIELLFVLTVDK